MITVKKLRTLAVKNRLRKCAAIFHYGALGQENLSYLADIAVVATEAAVQLDNGESNCERLKRLSAGDMGDKTLCADLCHEILHLLGAEPADWDFVTEDGSDLDGRVRKVLPLTLILDRIRSPFNVGSIFRTADSFGVEKVILIEGTASPQHGRAIRTARGTEETVDWEFMSPESAVKMIRSSCDKVIALELGGTNIEEFVFPFKGIAIVGSEEFGVSPELLQAVTDRVSIPLGGSKGSLNVSVATGIFLHSWFSAVSVSV